MDVPTMTQLISTVGFPIFVSVWLLVRSDQKEKDTQAVLLELKNVIGNCNLRIKA